jgi:hypothetical protein
LYVYFVLPLSFFLSNKRSLIILTLSLDGMRFSGIAWTFKFQHANTQTSMWHTVLILNLLMTTIVAPPSNASKWQMGFNSAFKGLKASIWSLRTLRFNIYKIVHSTYSCFCHDLNINDAFQILLYLLLNS